MTKKTISMNKKQTKAILQMVEKAYRRGFQQGVYASKNNPDIDEDEIYKWRFNKNINKHIPAPANESLYKAKETSFTLLDRLQAEVGSEEQREAVDCIIDILRKGQ